MRSMKTVGLVVVALLVYGAMASAASAIEFFEAKEYPVRVELKQKSGTKTAFKIGSSGAIECTTTTFTTAEPEFYTAKTKTLLFKSTLSGCTALGVLSATVTSLNGALDLLTIVSNKLKIKILASKGGTGGFISIKVPAASCEITVGEQELENTEAPVNLSNGTIEEPTSVSKIVYHSNEGSSACPKNGEEATFKGPLIAEGFNEHEEKVGIEVK